MLPGCLLLQSRSSSSLSSQTASSLSQQSPAPLISADFKLFMGRFGAPSFAPRQSLLLNPALALGPPPSIWHCRTKTAYLGISTHAMFMSKKERRVISRAASLSETGT